MAAPRVFVSSTYFDLKQVRAELEGFCRSMGLEPVLFEQNVIPYEGGSSLEEDCLREVERSDMLVSIIGSRLGTPAESNPNISLSQAELKRALELGQQVYIFVESAVYGEYLVFSENPEKAAQIKWPSGTSPEVFNFMQDVRNLWPGLQFFQFRTFQDITGVLRTQLAGLLQEYLRRRAEQKYRLQVNQLMEAVGAAQRIIEYLQRQEAAGHAATQEILFTRHPLFTRLRVVLNVPFRIFFENLEELERLLKEYGYERLDDRELIGEREKRYLFWQKKDRGGAYLGLHRSLFDDGRLLPLAQDAWNDDMLRTDRL